MIHLWEPAAGSWTVDPVPFSGHTASVEDLQVKTVTLRLNWVSTFTVSLWLNNLFFCSSGVHLKTTCLRRVLWMGLLQFGMSELGRRLHYLSRHIKQM